MYFSQVVVDEVVKSVPEIFNFVASESDQYRKKTKIDEELTEDGFPVEPVYWPRGRGVADIVGFRGHGAMAIVHGNQDGMVVTLGTGAPYESFLERDILMGTQAIKAESGTVLGDLSARSLWPNVEDNVRGPMFEGTSEAARRANMEMFVKEGRHVEGVAARLLALALEHALVPFTMRTRVRNASASYWCTGKYRSDNIIYSLQNVQAINAWSSPGGVGHDHDPTAVVWVGDATKTRGMALLSRIMDAGGPVYLQEAHLLKQFDEGRLLMAGTGSLRQDLRPVQPADLSLAIEEALWLLMVYNGLQLKFVRNALRLLIRNLPIMDRAHFDEQRVESWRVRAGMHGRPAVAVDRARDLERKAVAAFGAGPLTNAGLDSALKRLGVLSDLFRAELHAPVAGVAGLAPHQDEDTNWTCASVLAALQQPTVGNVNGVSVHFGVFDPAAPPALAPTLPPFRHEVVRDLYGCFSGRIGFHIFGYSQARAAGAAYPAVPQGWQRCAPQPAFPLPQGVTNDGAWMEWVGGNDAAGAPLVMTNEMRAYRVRTWVPAADVAHPAGYVRPPAALRRFRLKDSFQLSVRLNGAWPDLMAESSAMQNYVDANARGGDPLDYLTAEAAINLRGLTIGQRSVAVLVGYGFLWDAAHIGNNQNDAYARWVRANFKGEHLTTLPDELKLYLGGVRSRRYVEANGGLWTLCLQENVKETTISAGHEPVVEMLRDRSQLGSYMLKLRCAVEMSDIMADVANSRITGCHVPNIWGVALDDRLARGRIDHMTVVDAGSYLALQALILSSVFDHPDAVVARSFDVTACSTMRVREPRRGGVYTDADLKHMNWVSPQVLGVNTWLSYFGVAAPTFVPDRVGQSWLREARFTTAWNEVAEEFKPGVQVDKGDEVWNAVLGALTYTAWFPATVLLAQYGSSFRVDTSDVRRRHYDRYAPISARLCLPYETRYAHLVALGVGLNDNLRPRLPCDGTGGLANGRALPRVVVQINANGRVVDVTTNANIYSVIDVLDTNFCNGGMDFGLYNPSLVVGDYRDTNRSVGQFWVNTVVVDNRVSAGMSAGGQRLLAFLAPPEPIATYEDGGGSVARADDLLAANKPNIEKQLNPGSEGQNIGNVPIKEVGPGDAISVISNLTGLSDEDRLLLLSALAKREYVRDKGAASASTPSTSGTTNPGVSVKVSGVDKDDDSEGEDDKKEEAT